MCQSALFSASRMGKSLYVVHVEPFGKYRSSRGFPEGSKRLYHILERLYCRDVDGCSRRSLPHDDLFARL